MKYYKLKSNKDIWSDFVKNYELMELKPLIKGSFKIKCDIIGHGTIS